MQKKIFFYKLGILGLIKSLVFRSFGSIVLYHDVSTIVNQLLKLPLIGRALNNLFKRYTPEKFISEYEGSFFLIENITIELTSLYFDELNISSRNSLQFYKKGYQEKTIDTAIKFFIQYKIKSFLRFYYQLRRSGEDVLLIIPCDKIYKFIIQNDVFKDLKPIKFRYAGSGVWNSFNMLFILVSNLLIRLLIIFRTKYCFHNKIKKKYKICMRAHFPKKEGLLRNDFLIDDEQIGRDDVLFFLDQGDTEYSKRMISYYIENKYNYVVIDQLSIPVSHLPKILHEYIFKPIWFFVRFLFCYEWDTYESLVLLSTTAVNSKYERLFWHFDIDLMMLFHSGGDEMVAAAFICNKHDCKVGIYNFGSTVSWGRWAPYAFQIADYYFTWGGDIIGLYQPTCEFGEIVKTGFWGKDEYKKICRSRSELKRKILGRKTQDKIITFYDIPYFYERSTFSAKHLLEFYYAAIECSKLENVIVILKMKSTFNIDGAIFPDEYKKEFEQIWQLIFKKENMHILDTNMYDPLHIISISEVNVTLELSSPSTIALICGEAGIFYNVVFDYANHSLYPEYFNKLIFDDINELVRTINRHLVGEIDLKTIVNKDHLKGYDEFLDSDGLNRLRQAILERIK
ncbi:MAG: hypothetical protein ABIJ59_06255 [Pseudomonadota bacterium]